MNTVEIQACPAFDVIIRYNMLPTSLPSPSHSALQGICFKMTTLSYHVSIPSKVLFLQFYPSPKLVFTSISRACIIGLLVNVLLRHSPSIVSSDHIYNNIMFSSPCVRIMCPRKLRYPYWACQWISNQGSSNLGGRIIICQILEQEPQL